MNWNLLLLFFLLFVLFLKTPGILKLHSVRDAAAFYGTWTLSVMVTLADWADWPQLRPLDWVRSVMELMS
ncbi:hypothetical protein MKX70_12320 [Paenibacillus sp. FSL R7-0312]|uniref:hypothetical protein n=1 Tax=unclassified Paenibacillus TaxID=185978 RepID=UPI0004F7058F|nr:hypothetical protein [Paenibacillus sp. FSL R5-0912]AIQ43333.1 hypothetical protein R50912_27415 [Paenibacillus sp. FSL R5-0912]